MLVYRFAPNDEYKYRYALTVRKGYERKIIAFYETYDIDDTFYIKLLKEAYKDTLDSYGYSSYIFARYDISNGNKAGTCLPVYYMKDSDKIISDKEFLLMLDSKMDNTRYIASDNDIKEIIKDNFNDNIIMIYPDNITTDALGCINHPYKPDICITEYTAKCFREDIPDLEKHINMMIIKGLND